MYLQRILKTCSLPKDLSRHYIGYGKWTLRRERRPETGDFDKKQRRLGLTYAAENAIRVWDAHPEGSALANAYTAGVNAYVSCIGPRDYPLEFKLLNYKPEPWTTLKTALFLESMSTRLCMREFDMEYTLLRDALGEDVFEYLFPDYNPRHDPVIPAGTEWPFAPVATDASKGTFPGIESTYGGVHQPQDDYFEGSNNWALAGSRTASGKPILCNDPHLHFSLPATFYEIHLHAPGYNCYGVSLPGIPGIIIGFNDYIAWGMTNAGYDVLDWYQISWTDSTKTRYELDGGERDAEIREERIEIRGGRPVIDSVRYTVWGPVWRCAGWLMTRAGPPSLS
jgi:penicillin amidase